MISCSTKKTGWAHRTYHNTTSRYNGYFNAKEKFKEAVDGYEASFEDDYLKLLPVFKFGNLEARQSLTTSMDVVVEKATKTIKRHSIEVKNKQHVRWIDNCYYVMGKAYFYKGDMQKAHEMFNYVSKKHKDEDTHANAIIYLARLNIEKENYEKAERLLSIAERKTLDRDQKLLFHQTQTQLYIILDNDKRSIDALTAAIPLYRKKKDRARATYLLGQLYKRLSKYNDATTKFEQVIKMHPDYKLLFYSKIQLAMVYKGRAGGKELVRKELLKMLNDEKYLEFRDQIYYALGEMEYFDKNKPAAIDYLKKSTEVSTTNTNQKGLSFLRLGEIYFADLEYKPAQKFYDSSLVYLQPEYEGYEDVVRISENLNELVTQIQTIHEQDSLQKVAAMDSVALMERIEDIILRKTIKEEKKKEQAEDELASEETNINGFPNNVTSKFGGPKIPGADVNAGKWYFYNPTVMGQGAAEFKSVWGSRRNEDDWRRSNKRTISLEGLESGEEVGELSNFLINEKGDTVQIEHAWQDPNYYLKEIPNSPEKIKISNDKILEAYYKLAAVYREKMQDDDKAISTIKEMNERFANHKYKAASYYTLHILYKEKKDGGNAGLYRNKILKEFPNSDYAKLLRDPDFLKKSNEEDLEAEKAYQKAFANYRKGYYQYAGELCDKVLQDYPQTKLKPKVEFLRVLCLGGQMGQETLIKELKNIANSYPEDEVGKKAADILAGLNQAKASKEKEAAKKEALKDNPFKYDGDSEHIFVMLVSSKDKVNIIKSRITTFNAKNFRGEKLKVSSVIYNDEYEMISIKNFENADKVMLYFTSLKAVKGALKKTIDKKYDMFPMSRANYPTFYQTKKLEAYKAFFQMNYMEGQ